MTFIMFYSILNDYFAILCYVERYFAIYLRFSWKIFHSIVAVAVCTVQYSAVMLEASSICIFCFYSILGYLPHFAVLMNLFVFVSSVGRHLYEYVCTIQYVFVCTIQYVFVCTIHYVFVCTIQYVFVCTIQYVF